MSASVRKKLIEVSIPLEAINVASGREKSIRHGHPWSLHLWWARRPLAACRAVLFAQLVDDPSAWPERFPTVEAQDVERRRLHKVIERLVPWEASNDEDILTKARWEIARSVAWNLGEEPPSPENSRAILDYLQSKAPAVYDPFSGGGSIPLEAQRLGLRAEGSDLNPVAVLIGKAQVEIPPKFEHLPPVNSASRVELSRGGRWNGTGAQGLAEDIRYFGQWMRDQAEERVGHLYPKVKLDDGSEATVVAWLWARTVRSPDPAAKGAMVPLVSSFMLSTKEGKKAWLEPIIDASAPDGWRFEVHSGELSKQEESRLKGGTKTTRGQFACLLTGTAIPEEYSRAQGVAGQIGHRMIAVIAEGSRKRAFLTPTAADEMAASCAMPDWVPEGELFPRALGFRVPGYGMTRWADLYTNRQLTMLTAFSDLIPDVKKQVETCLTEIGEQREGYADAIATYLAFLVDQMANHSSLLCGWNSANAQMRSVFSRQALSMTWDYAEVNLFSDSSGSFNSLFDRMIKGFSGLPPMPGYGSIIQCAAQDASIPTGAVISTDPPYYDNIGYADLSDFFYSWLKVNLGKTWPDLFRRILTPKDIELVATPHRHGGVGAAHDFFMNGMGQALKKIEESASGNQPITIFYAFKQSETSVEGVTSAGWSSFLQAIVNNGLLIDGTWPLDTEKKGRTRDIGTNALASSIVLVCRKRAASAGVTTRSEFIRALKSELPEAISAIRKAGVGPVDMQQSVIGPGMGVFSRHSKVLEDDDSVMSVSTALAIINRVWEEIENELDAFFDPETQVAIAWYSTFGFDGRSSGELITLANAKNIPSSALFSSGVFTDGRGKASLTERNALPLDWTPAADKHLTVWECVQHTARVLNAPDGGAEAAARLVSEMGSKANDARALAYRLFEIATQKGWSNEALIYNELAQEWTHLEDLVVEGKSQPKSGAQGAFQFA